MAAVYNAAMPSPNDASRPADDRDSQPDGPGPQRRFRGRPRSFDRDDALDRAMREFWQRGYDSTSIAGLTEVMGINAPSLYSAFGDKRALFEAAIQRYMETEGVVLWEGLEEAPTARKGLEQVLRVIATAYADPSTPRGCMVLSSATSLETADPDLQDALRLLRQVRRQTLEDRFRRAINDGERSADTDIGALARFFAATVQGLSAEARDGATHDDLQQIVTYALRSGPS